MIKQFNLKGYENYYVSDEGKVYKKINGELKEKNQSIDRYGYNYSSYTNSENGERKKIKTHRIVAITFIPNPLNKLTVNHINAIKTDNRVENLEWATIQEQAAHVKENHLINAKKGKDNYLSRKIYCFNKKLQLIGIFYGIREASRKTGVPTATINDHLTKEKFGKELEYYFTLTNKEPIIDGQLIGIKQKIKEIYSGIVFDSMNEAKRQLLTSTYSINKSLKNNETINSFYINEYGERINRKLKFEKI